MDTRTPHLTKTALILSGAALAVAACGSGGNASTSDSANGRPSTAASSGAIVSTASVGGTDTLVSADGRTLYDADVESSDHILCVAACTTFWKPVMASRQQAQQAGTALGLSLTVAMRPDGGTQLAFDGHPLYTFTQEGTHEMSGNGVEDEFGSTRFEWSAATTGGASNGQPSSGTDGGGNDDGGNGGGGGFGY